MAMLTTASTTQAQISTVPKRHRNKIDYRPQEFGRKQRQQRGQQQQQQKKKTNLRELEGDLSIPIQESKFDMSMPSGSSVRMMSIPLQESGFDLSMPLQESGLDLSMPTIGDNPTQVHVGDSEDITLGNGSTTPILASFLVGISLLVVGAVAFFVKMQQKHDSRVEESQQERDEIMSINLQNAESDAQTRIVLVAPSDDLGETDREMQDIVII